MGSGAQCLVALRRAVSAALGALALAAIAPVSAGAMTTCEYIPAAEVLNVKLNFDSDSATLRLIGVDTIDVRQSGVAVSCSGGTPTASNTDFINVTDESSNGSPSLVVAEAPNLAGVGINFVSGNGSLDTIVVHAVPATPAQFLAGATGVSTDGDTSTDINFVGAIPESIVLVGSAGGDTISARGGGNTGAPVSGASLEFRGEGGNDALEGGEGGDLLNGDFGNDTLRGFGGPDALVGDGPGPPAGDDLYDGGAEADTARFGTAPNGVTVDLAKAGPQAAGEGSDTFASVENVDGSKFADTLLGDAGPNHLSGQSGDDILDGRAGNDALHGGANTDTLTYAGAPAGVTASLTAIKTSGGSGTDEVQEFENLIGSPFADTLTGSAAANTITALGGADTVQALAGPDRVEVRDGGPDTASCGSELDTALADRRSVDTVQADCELVDALPEPPGPTGGGGGAGPGGGSSGPRDNAVAFHLRGARKQRLLVQQGVILKLRCPLEACAVSLRASGRLPDLAGAAASAKRRLQVRPRRAQLAPGPARIVRLPLTKPQLGLIDAALRQGKHPKLRLTATATDAAGNSKTARLTVTAKP